MSDTLTFNVPTHLMPSLDASETGGGSPRWYSVTVRTLREAEQSLDAAEATGYLDCELIVRTPRVFVVRWR